MVPDFSWLPAWAILGLCAVVGLFVLMMACVPFAVFGTKPRLQELEYQIAELRVELQQLTLRITAPPADRVVASPSRENGMADTVVYSAGPSYEDGPSGGRLEPMGGSHGLSSGWARAPWEEREELSPRSSATRRRDEEEPFVSRSEPKLRWPPRP